MKCTIHDRAYSTSYTKFKCRCEDCVQWNSEYSAAKRNQQTPEQKAQLAARKAEYYHRNKDNPKYKEQVKRAQKRYFASEKGRKANLAAFYRRYDRTKLWRAVWTDENWEQWYELVDQRDQAKADTGIDHDIDHIVPLNVGGPDHPANMRILTASENRSRPKDGSDLK